MIVHARAYECLGSFVVEFWTTAPGLDGRPATVQSLAVTLEQTESVQPTLPELAQALARAIQEWAWVELGV
jgi:hypothetical protein